MCAVGRVVKRGCGIGGCGGEDTQGETMVAVGGEQGKVFLASLFVFYVILLLFTDPGFISFVFTATCVSGKAKDY